MKWAILGSAGMLGQDFIKALPNAEGFDRDEFDLTNLNSVRKILVDFDVVVNCAAWTAVDEAEENEETAHAINGVGPKNVAIICSEIGARMVQISTDYVFSGNADQPYQVDDSTGPKSAYGRTKLAGEIAVKAELPESHFIVRTAWLYGEHGPNFVKTMQSLEKSKATVSVVDDQLGQPTWTADLVEQVLKMIELNVPAGIYHATASGQTSWFEFAKRIFKEIGADPNRVLPTTSDAFVRPAPRPAYSVLSHDKWALVGMKPIRNWDDALSDAFEAGAFSAS